MSHLGEFFRRRRAERGLGLGDLARLLGYRNVSKGANRIRAFEGGGKVHPALLGNLADVLEIGPDEIRRLVAEDHTGLAGLGRRADPALRGGPADGLRVPAGPTARRRPRPRGGRGVRRRRGPWAEDAGLAGALPAGVGRVRRGRGRGVDALEATPEMPCEPFAVVGGHRVQFDLDAGVAVRPIDGPPK